MISLCITCHNRLWQLKKTLPENLLIAEKKKIEICLVDYGSTDGLEDWIRSNFMCYIDKGILVFFKTQYLFYNCPHAKNIAHVLASRDILGNLDCDNFINDQIIDLIDLIDKNKNYVIQNWSGSYTDGTYGRIFMSRENFLRLGGYDEKIKGIMFQDKDFLERVKKCSKLSLKIVSFKGKSPVNNSFEDKTKNLGRSYFGKRILRNKLQFKFNDWGGLIVVNNREMIGASKGRLNFEKLITSGKRANYKRERKRQLTLGLKKVAEDFIYKAFLSLKIIINFIIWKAINPFFYKVIHPLYYNVFYRAGSIFLHKVIYRAVRISKRIKKGAF